MRKLLDIRRLVVLSLFTGISSLADDLRIATYNLNNYLVMDRNVDGRWRPNYPKPEIEKTMIRQVIKESDADVLVLQEMGAVEFLEELRSDLANEGLHYDYAVHLEAADQDRHLAVLSRRSPVEVVKHRNLDFKYFDGREVVKRGMLELTLALKDGTEVQLFCVHLKSRYAEKEADPDSLLRRMREAEACRNLIIERTFELERRHFLVLGDFNDHPASGPLRRFYKRGELAIGVRIPASDSRGHEWTYYYDNESRYDTVDGIIASEALLPRVRMGEGTIADIPGALTASDHRLVYIDLIDVDPAE